MAEPALAFGAESRSLGPIGDGSDSLVTASHAKSSATGLSPARSAASAHAGEQHPSARHGVPVLYEFLNRYETNLFNTAEDSVAFLRMFHTQNVKLLCDLFHMNIEERDVAAALKLAGDKVGHVHFADTNRLAIGGGHLDVTPIAQALRDLGYDGFISAEVLPLPDGVAAAKQTIASFRKFFPR